MSFPVVDCQSLIEFCRAYEQHRNTPNPSSNRNNNSHSNMKKHWNYLNPLSHPFCDKSQFVAIDVIALLLVLGALTVLMFPYFKFIFGEFCEVFPEVCELVRDLVRSAPAAYVVSFVAGLALMIGLWEILSLRSRKCGNPFCKGLRKAVEFDIQLETEQCVKYLPSLPKDIYGVQPLELGEDHKELEAELKKMAPLNGRTVLIFRAPCGCPASRMEVWGPKKLRRIKK